MKTRIGCWKIYLFIIATPHQQRRLKLLDTKESLTFGSCDIQVLPFSHQCITGNRSGSILRLSIESPVLIPILFPFIGWKERS